MSGRARHWWLPWGRAVDTTAEARDHLNKLEERAAQVDALGDHLRAAQRRNHFSEMVGRAISRAAEGGSP